MAVPATGRGVRGDLCRCVGGEDPQAARSPTGRSTPPSVSPWTGTRTFWGCGPAPAVRAPSFPMSVLTDIRRPRRQGRVLPGLRRFEGLARGGGQRLAADHGRDLSDPLDQKYVPVDVQEGLGCGAAGRETDLHRGQRRRGTVGVRGLRSSGGAANTRPSFGSGATHGKSSSRSWTTLTSVAGQTALHRPDRTGPSRPTIGAATWRRCRSRSTGGRRSPCWVGLAQPAG